eukprot:6084373-Amphidinium_carterae.1
MLQIHPVIVGCTRLRFKATSLGIGMGEPRAVHFLQGQRLVWLAVILDRALSAPSEASKLFESHRMHWVFMCETYPARTGGRLHKTASDAIARD